MSRLIDPTETPDDLAALNEREPDPQEQDDEQV